MLSWVEHENEKVYNLWFWFYILNTIFVIHYSMFWLYVSAFKENRKTYGQALDIGVAPIMQVRHVHKKK